MIKSEYVSIKINNRNIRKIRSYNSNESLKIGDIVTLPISILDTGSHVEVECVCDVCGSVKDLSYQKYIKNIKNGGYYSCSSKCSQEKVKKTSLRKYGEEYYMKTKEYTTRVNKTNSKKYGSNWYLTSDIGSRKISEAIKEKFGVNSVFSNEDIKSKISKSVKEKWGVDNISKSDEIKNKISLKNKKNWNNRYKKYYKDNYGLEVVNYKSSIYSILCLDCNSIYDINRLLLSNRLLLETKTCLICNPTEKYNRSGYESQLLDYIKSLYDGHIVCNEIDIYLPNLNIAFEFNGLYWHSDLYKEKDYHYKKHKICKDKNIELFQIWEDDWLYKNDIIKSMICNKIGYTKNKIYARQCEIREVDSKTANLFLEKNHLQGRSNSKINIALYYNNEVVSIMCFGSLRKSLGTTSKKGDYELHRFCNKLNMVIVGGASRIFKYFINTYEFNKIISYYDKSFGFKNFYNSIGFEFLGETPINYFYLKSGIRIHRYNYSKSKLVKMGYDEKLTENEITKKIGINKIYGVGNYKYIIECNIKD
jgi:hypothetical protein